VISVRVEPDCFTGGALEFLNWRLLIARAAGYGVQGWEQDDVTYLLPNIDYESMTVENILGIWDIEPEDVLLVLLAHSDEEGAIYPIHMGPLADRLEELLPELAQFSQHEEDSPAQTTEVLVTQRFIDGVRAALSADTAITFHSEDMS